MTRKEEINKSFKDYNLEDTNKGIILFNQGINCERELIINPEGIDKISYINTAYNDDLELISNTKIKINNYSFFDNRNPIDLKINLGKKMGDMNNGK